MTPRIMVSGSIAAGALAYGGMSWAFLQYVLGFRRLGCETLYVEYLDTKKTVDEHWNPVPFDRSANVRYFERLVERWGLEGSVALLEKDGSGHVGMDHAAVRRRARDTDVLLNLSGRLHDPEVLGAVRRRLYVDMDPGYTQIWQEGYGVDMNVRGHDVYVTVGLNIGGPGCPLPTCGVRWETTLPPTVLEEWATTDPPGDAYTTVADWRGFSPVEWRGVWYGQKADEFRRIIDLPRHAVAPLELCLFLHTDEPDRAALLAHGWRLADPAVRAPTADAYRDYLRGSRGEFTVVKSGYAAGNTGWVSDRSTCYLAAGRPVIVQDTGIGRYLPTGKGLLTFTDLESAAAAIAAVEGDYAGHAAAALDLARSHMDARIVLPRLLALAGV